VKKTSLKYKRLELCAVVRGIAVLGGLSVAATSSMAFQFETDNPDVSARWDNTIKYSAAQRLNDPSPALTANVNNDDGNRNFSRGLISSRFDLLSEFDVVYKKNIGMRISAAAWSDSVYNNPNFNPGLLGGAVPNQTSVAYNQFTDATRNVHGTGSELLDAFVFGKFDLGGRGATVRVGRHSVLWGESLFLGGNAIAGAMMPVDVVKLLSVPGTQFKEAIRPVPMVSGQILINSNVSVGAYLQTTSSKSRTPAVGSYFSSADVAVDGAENMWVGPGVSVPRLADMNARDSGQGGLQLKVRGDEVDFGFYAIQFHSKTPQLVPTIGMTPGGPAPVGYYLAYHENVKAIGASVSKTFGDYNVAAELSFRDNQDLASTRGSDVSSFTSASATNNSSNPAYAVGRTTHLNVSFIGNVPSTPLWKEATIAGEIAWNRVLKITKNAQAADPNGTRDGIALRAVIEPMYRQVLPGVDMSVPIGIGYAPRGSRPLVMNPSAWIPEGGGDISVGLNATYRDAWRFRVNYTHYFGDGRSFNEMPPSNSYSWGQTLKDRDFISILASYSF